MGRCHSLGKQSIELFRTTKGPSRIETVTTMVKTSTGNFDSKKSTKILKAYSVCAFASFTPSTLPQFLSVTTHENSN